MYLHLAVRVGLWIGLWFKAKWQSLLGNIPLTVIQHGIPDLFASMPVEQAKQADRVWQELQAELTQLSSNSQMIVAEKSGHGIQIDQPGLVVDAILQMVHTVRGVSTSIQGTGD